jgi:hypothetical protein
MELLRVIFSGAKGDDCVVPPGAAVARLRRPERVRSSQRLAGTRGARGGYCQIQGGLNKNAPLDR